MCSASNTACDVQDALNEAQYKYAASNTACDVQAALAICIQWPSVQALTER